MCPRVHYFDAHHTRTKRLSRRRVTYLWKSGDRPAGGAVFHAAIERFTKLAATAPEVRRAIEHSETASELHQELARYVNQRCLDLAALQGRSVEFRQGLVAAQHLYLEELSNLVMYGLSSGETPKRVIACLFGDERKAVDITFHLTGERAVRVTGLLDYVFFDWRTSRYRIFDYKLTPASHNQGDVVQASAYALMHDRQHGTRPDVAVYYLHPVRHFEERTWDQVWGERHQVYGLLTSMLEWEAYDEGETRGLKPPGSPEFCPLCPWRKRCVARLGPKGEGERAEASSAADGRNELLAEAGARPEQAAADLLVTLESEPGDVDAVIQRAPEEPGGDPLLALSGRSDATAVESTSAADGLCVGFDDRGEPVVVPTQTLDTHVAVVGAAGSGKTYTAKIIAEEAVRNGVPVLAVDPQGDLVQFLRQRDRDTIDPRLHDAFDGYCGRVAPRVFTPGTSHAQRLCLSPMRLPRAEDLLGIEDPERRREEELSMLQSASQNLVSLANLSGDRTAQETFLYRVLLALPRGQSLSLSDVVAACHAPDDLGIDDLDLLIKKPDLEKLARRLHAYVVGPAAQLFEGGTPLDLDELTRTVDGRVPLNVIYLNALTNDAQKQFFMAALASEIYRWMVTRGGSGSTNLLLYLDEARDYVPAGGKMTPAKQPLIRLFSQGRKYGVGCLLCTQSPRSVDYNVFTNCSSKVIGRLESAQDVERVREWFSTGSPPRWLEGRKGAEKGSFVARWEGGETRDGSPFRGRQLFSVHEGAWSPDRVESEVNEGAAAAR